MKNKYINKKLGLVAAIYTATSLAMPALANQVKEPVQPINLERVITLDQIENTYKQKLTEYSQDKKLNSQEIRILCSIIKKGRGLGEYSEIEKKFKTQSDGLTQQIAVLRSEREELLTPLKNLEKKIKLSNEEIVRIEEESKGMQLLFEYEQDFENLRKGLDDLFSEYYPGLIKDTDSKYNLTYNAGDFLIHAAEEELYPILSKAIEIFKNANHPKSKEIEYFWHRQITISEMISFRKLLESTQNIKPTLKNYSGLKNQLNIMQQLEQEKNQTGEKLNPSLKTLEGKMTELEQKLYGIKQKSEALIFSSQKLEGFESYIKALEKKEEFIRNNVDVSQYWTSSMWLIHKLDKETKEADPKYNFKTEVSMLEKLLKYEGLEVEVADIKNPTSIKYNQLITFFMGMGFAYLRNFLIAPFIIKRKIDMFDFMEPLFTSILGLTFLDGIHPLVFPLRMVGMPFIVEPIRRLTKLQKVK